MDLLIPELADACALDVLDPTGVPQRFAGRIDGPDGARQSAWLASLKPRTDAPQSAARQALDDGGVHVVRAHAGAHRADHLRRRGRRADGGHRRPLVGRGPARRRRPQARAAGLRAARGARGAGPEQLSTLPRRRRSRRPRAAHDPADLRPAPHARALRAHPRGARRGGHRPGRGRPDGLRQHGRGAARGLRDAGGAAGHARGRADRALRDHRRRRQPGRSSRTCPLVPAAGRARRAAAADPLASTVRAAASCG